jgi:hypothetical protein
MLLVLRCGKTSFLHNINLQSMAKIPYEATRKNQNFCKSLKKFYTLVEPTKNHPP